MSTITKERIANLIEFNSEGSDCQANAEQWEVHELARIALTSLEAEPVADVVAWSSQNEERTCDVRLRRHDIKPGILYTAPPAPVSVPDLLEQFAEFMAAESIKSGDYPDGWQSKASNAAHEYAQNIRAAMLQAGNSPVAHDGWVMVPKKLTAENGAKGVLSGEFSETKFINCPECFGDDDCETCDGSGRIEITVPVTWTTIKAIWAKGVEHFAAAPQQEVKS